MQQVVMIVPVDTNVDVAQNVAEKDGKHRPERRQI
jgi:hypothetical protein